MKVTGSRRVRLTSTLISLHESSGRKSRSLGSDPATPFLANRHIDIDLAGEMTEMGLLADRSFSLRDSQGWVYQALLIDTIVHVERG